MSRPVQQMNIWSVWRGFIGEVMSCNFGITSSVKILNSDLDSCLFCNSNYVDVIRFMIHGLNFEAVKMT